MVTLLKSSASPLTASFWHGLGRSIVLPERSTVTKNLSLLLRNYICYRQDHNRALMLMYVVIIFILCYSPQVNVVYHFITTQEPIDPVCAYFGYVERWSIGQSFGNLLMTVNASVNMIIYCFKDEQFRQVAMGITGIDEWMTKESKTDSTELTRT